MNRVTNGAYFAVRLHMAAHKTVGLRLDTPSFHFAQTRKRHLPGALGCHIGKALYVQVNGGSQTDLKLTTKPDV